MYHNCLLGYEAESEVLKQRIRGPLGGDGGSFNYQKLHYLSLHSLDKQQFSYGRMRVVRELTDSFFDGAVTYGGARFQNEPVRLTDEELLKTLRSARVLLW